MIEGLLYLVGFALLVTAAPFLLLDVGLRWRQFGLFLALASATCIFKANLMAGSMLVWLNAAVMAFWAFMLWGSVDREGE